MKPKKITKKDIKSYLLLHKTPEGSFVEISINNTYMLSHFHFDYDGNLIYCDAKHLKNQSGVYVNTNHTVVHDPTRIEQKMRERLSDRGSVSIAVIRELLESIGIEPKFINENANTEKPELLV